MLSIYFPHSLAFFLDWYGGDFAHERLRLSLGNRYWQKYINSIGNTRAKEEVFKGISNKSFQSTKPSYSAEENMKGSVNPVMDVLSADIVTKPFCIAAGAAKDPNAKFNPFRKKSGLLNVLAKQAKVWSVI